MKSLLIVAVLSGLAAAQPAGVAVPAGPPPGRKLIFVVQKDNRLAAYDATDFHLWSTGVLPPEAAGHPERISISPQGAVMVTFPAGENLSRRRIWQSDPRLAYALAGGTDDETPAPGDASLVTKAAPEVYFTADPERLFWCENRQQILTRNNAEVSVDNTFLAWTTDRQGGNLRQAIEVRFPKCECTTAVCEESCPEARVWAPESGIADYFFVTRWIPGQTQPTFQQTELYRLQDGRWASQKVAKPVEQFANMADHGNLYVEVIGDGGCCGWENEGNDQTLLVRNGQSIPIYDERQRFHNDNYDVSFFTERVRLSPDNTRVAYTLASTAKSSEGLRVSDSGKDSPEELKRLTKALGTVPLVEVLAVANPKKIVVSVPGQLVGWLDYQRILIVQAGKLAVVDASSGAKTETPVQAANAQQVFIP